MKKILYSYFFVIIFIVSFYAQNKSFKIINISDSPVNSFKKYCSRCHGYEGSAYGKGFGDMEDAKLKKVIKEMMIGPAQLKPDTIEIEAMYSYNKSLRDKKPFGIILNSKSFLEGKDDILLINVSPKTDLIVSDTRIKIDKMQDVYKLSYESKEINTIKLTITRNNVPVIFDFPEKLWSE